MKVFETALKLVKFGFVLSLQNTVVSMSENADPLCATNFSKYFKLESSVSNSITRI